MNSNAAFTINSETEELLVHYLDGTLSASDQTRFEALLRQNPAFADEVRAISSFDEMLDDAHLDKRWLDRADAAFLSEMQQQFAQVAVLGAATAIAGTSAAAASGVSTTSVASSGISAATAAKTASVLGAGKLATLLTGAALTKVVLVTAVCGGIGYGAWKYAASKETPLSAPQASAQRQGATSSSETTPKAAQPPTPNAENALSAERTQTKANLVQKPSSQTEKSATQTQTTPQSVSQNVQQDAKQSDVLTAPTEQDSKTSANIESSAAQELRAKIEQLAAQVRAKEQSGDKAGLAFDAKKLGMLERTAGKFGESSEHFDKALKAAQSLKLRELEGEIKAEFALLLREQGNTEKALQSLREAVKILTDEHSPKAAKWSKELERLEKR
ncbi:MAG: tetratricopeptide repeat protein [Candidatus Kapabacteria bacterium]|jgi:anti-sigma factor RsiW|nr:tetratricopeptide repeat protein [Candidatus Kapabacteria bacterium]